MGRILIINFSIAYTKYLSNLSKKIADKNIIMEYIWCRSMDYWEATEEKNKYYLGKKINSISIPIKNDAHGKYEETISFNFFSYLIKKKPDILILDSNLATSFWYIIIAKLFKTKIISFTTNFPDTNRIWGKLSNKILKFNDFLIDQYIVPSTRKKEELQKIGIEIKKIINIGHGVNTELFCFKEKKELTNIPINKKIILSVGRFNRKKGKKFLIDSFQILQNDVNDSFLILIGDGPERENIEKRIHEKNLDKHIILINSVKNSEMPNYYSVADVIVVPTTEPEPFGPIYLEGMASSKPIIAFDVGGGEKDLIQNGKNGLLVKNKDVVAMAQSIKQVLLDNNKKKEMGEYSRKIIEENYSYEVLAKKWRDVIYKLLKNDRKPN